MQILCIYASPLYSPLYSPLFAVCYIPLQLAKYCIHQNDSYVLT